MMGASAQSEGRTRSLGKDRGASRSTSPSTKLRTPASQRDMSSSDKDRSVSEVTTTSSFAQPHDGGTAQDARTFGRSRVGLKSIKTSAKFRTPTSQRRMPVIHNSGSAGAVQLSAAPTDFPEVPTDRARTCPTDLLIRLLKLARSRMSGLDQDRHWRLGEHAETE
eukprot:CAMPEP_0180656640 /NCGR_PEP_ID=MMETSP1037_2-20121125/55970_1 /TAXON_ID=632150 /ORGANISM="Azadinium spinosum, Strain 3D9" /LENGTH=164 /DNA_ID=CAMNT_0022683257 /DNA_START=70 /DNA_END=561 /DNA_ORIENTATION=+